jgi:hypothetical protein
MAPLRSSSSGCKPAVMPRIEMLISWGGERERELCVRTLDVPAELFMGFLCSIKSPPPATRRRRRTDRKGKRCKEMRKWSRDRVSDSVRAQEAGVVDVAELTGCVSGADVCVSGDSVLGDLVGHVAPDHVASSRTVLRPSVVSLPFPRPTRVAGVGGLVTGHGGTRPVLQEPRASSVVETSLQVAEGAVAAAAAAVAAAAALGAAASARAAISAVQDSLGSARRQRKSGKRKAKKFVGLALSRVWRARTVAQQEREEFPVLAVDESADSGSCLVSSEFAEGAGAGVVAAGAAAVAFAAAASARAAISAVQDSLGTARRLRKSRKRDAKKLARVVADAAFFGPVAEVPTARVVDDEVCGCLDGDALFDICFQVLVPTLSISSFLPPPISLPVVHFCVALLGGKDAEFLRYAMRDTSRGNQLEVYLKYWLDECAECSKGRFETAAFMKEIIRGEGSVRYEDLWRLIS